MWGQNIEVTDLIFHDLWDISPWVLEPVCRRRTRSKPGLSFKLFCRNLNLAVFIQLQKNDIIFHDVIIRVESYHFQIHKLLKPISWAYVMPFTIADWRWAPTDLQQDLFVQDWEGFFEVEKMHGIWWVKIKVYLRVLPTQPGCSSDHLDCIRWHDILWAGIPPKKHSLHDFHWHPSWDVLEDMCFFTLVLLFILLHAYCLVYLGLVV